MVRATIRVVWYHAHTQVSDELKNVSVTLAQCVILQLFERATSKTKLLTDDLDDFAFRNLLINFVTADRVPLFLEDNVATVGENCFLYISIGTLVLFNRSKDSIFRETPT